MFGLTTILSTSVALLLAAQSVSAAPTHEISRSLIPRQSTTNSPQCKALCDPANAIVAAAPKDACTDANVDKVAACFNCAVAAGEDREIVQEVGDGLVDVCKTAGFPVKSVTIGAGGAAGGTGTPPCHSFWRVRDSPCRSFCSDGRGQKDWRRTEHICKRGGGGDRFGDCFPLYY
ncbi:hypothetical protein C8J57DRAFT_1377344, partial [Mycena rebaudengoi]